MGLKERYDEASYRMLGALREFVEEGVVFSDFDYWLETAQGYKEIEVIERRSEFILKDPYSNNPFVIEFIKEDFDKFEENIPKEIIPQIFELIKDKEGEESVRMTKLFLIDYAVEIAKASNEFWSSFITGSSDISEKEQAFILELSKIFLL